MPPVQPSATAQSVGGNVFYVDSIDGDDANPGTGSDKAWKTLTPVHSNTFLPGDVIHFRRGSSWSGLYFALEIDDSGVEGNPITFTTYGKGDMPIFRATGQSGHAVIIRGSWIVVDGFHVTNTEDAAFHIEEDANHNVIKNSEVDNSGLGFAVGGQNNLITQNDVHDLKMIVNTPGGDDDYGAVGVQIYNSNNEISYNRFVNCKASSYDYGYDGGGIEIFAERRDIANNYIHHNMVENSAGFMEIGGRRPAEAKNNIVAYNLGVNNGEALHFNLGTYQYGIDVNNFRFENNTLIDNQVWRAFNFTYGELSGNQLVVRNSIFYGFRHLADTTDFYHSYNLYYGLDGTISGEGERIGDPLFKSQSDYHVQSGSPAIDAGDNSFWIGTPNIVDFEGNQITDEEGNIVAFGGVVDMGGYEYQDEDGDTDDDGVPDEEECGPAGTDVNYDGNNDGIPDSQQDSVTSFHTHDMQNYVTLAVDSPIGATLSNCRALPPPGGGPAGTSFPYGFFEFTVNGAPIPPAKAIVTLYLHSGQIPGTYYKYGRTPMIQNDHWYEFLYDGETGAEINGNVINLHFVDGERGDDVLSQDGMVIDQGGPGVINSGGNSSSSGGGGGGCFIATAAYRSPVEKHERRMLCDFRDKWLLSNYFGRQVVEVYYKFSPSVADYLQQHSTAGTAVRYALIPVMGVAYLVLRVHLIILLVGFASMLVAAISLLKHFRSVRQRAKGSGLHVGARNE
jgi:hypothetical protein